MIASRYTLKKGERLRKKKYIALLFQSKNRFLCYPFRVVCGFLGDTKEDFPAQFFVSIPKRKIKKAVSRNLLKRRTREAYRLQKHRLDTQEKEGKVTLALGVVYVADEVLPYKNIEEAMKEIIGRINRQMEDTNNLYL